MRTYILLDSRRLVDSFLGMNLRSRTIHNEKKDKLLSVNKITLSDYDIIGNEYMLWLQKKGIVKEQK
jgi:hypothetical protein